MVLPNSLDLSSQNTARKLSEYIRTPGVCDPPEIPTLAQSKQMTEVEMIRGKALALDAVIRDAEDTITGMVTAHPTDAEERELTFRRAVSSSKSGVRRWSCCVWRY